jgi:nicotinamidase-related amidase
MAGTAKFDPHLASPDSSVLVVIDIQEKLLPHIHDGEAVMANTRKLMRIADIFEVPVLLTEQYPQGLGPSTPPVREAFDALQTEKHFFTKDSFSCNLEPTFLDRLVELDQKITQKQSRLIVDDGLTPRPIDIIVAGIECHVCVLQTVMGLLPLGYYVRVCHDCAGSRSAENKNWALRSMLHMGATVASFESVAFEWARDKNHPRFRDLNKILKE